MENLVKEKTYRGFNIKIYLDETPQNPRTEWDNLGTMVCWHSRYSLGDKHDWETPNDFHRALKDEEKVILSLYLYDHSGVTISTKPFSCPWDSGQVGYIYVTREKLQKEKLSDRSDDQIKEILRNEVKTYDQYISGEVYGYMIEPTDRNKEMDFGDSCWGYYGDDGIAQIDAEAKESIDEAIKEYREAVKARVAKAKVTDLPPGIAKKIRDQIKMLELNIRKRNRFNDNDEITRILGENELELFIKEANAEDKLRIETLEWVYKLKEGANEKADGKANTDV